MSFDGPGSSRTRRSRPASVTARTTSRSGRCQKVSSVVWPLRLDVLGVEPGLEVVVLGSVEHLGERVVDRGDEPAARPQDASELGERPVPVLEVVQHQGGDDHVVGLVLVGQRLRQVVHGQRDRATQPAASQVDHRRAPVEAGDVRATGDGLGGQRPGPAPGVEDAPALHVADQVQHGGALVAGVQQARRVLRLVVVSEPVVVVGTHAVSVSGAGLIVSPSLVRRASGSMASTSRPGVSTSSRTSLGRAGHEGRVPVDLGREEPCVVLGPDHAGRLRRPARADPGSPVAPRRVGEVVCAGLEEHVGAPGAAVQVEGRSARDLVGQQAGARLGVSVEESDPVRRRPPHTGERSAQRGAQSCACSPDRRPETTVVGGRVRNLGGVRGVARRAHESAPALPDRGDAGGRCGGVTCEDTCCSCEGVRVAAALRGHVVAPAVGGHSLGLLPPPEPDEPRVLRLAVHGRAEGCGDLRPRGASGLERRLDVGDPGEERLFLDPVPRPCRAGPVSLDRVEDPCVGLEASWHDREDRGEGLGLHRAQPLAPRDVGFPHELLRHRSISSVSPPALPGETPAG